MEFGKMNNKTILMIVMILMITVVVNLMENMQVHTHKTLKDLVMTL